MARVILSGRRGNTIRGMVAIIIGSASIVACTSSGSTPEVATPAVPATNVSSEPAEPIFQASDFFQVSAGELDRLLGPASLRRQEGEGEFRQYPFKTCSLIVILYKDEDGSKAVHHLDAAGLSSSDAKPDLETCLAVGPAGLDKDKAGL
ncbi:MAG: hypothetical protein AAFY84_02410 [Pseudomonadota bacterium]